jgi:hypothetical protein
MTQMPEPLSYQSYMCSIRSSHSGDCEESILWDVTPYSLVYFYHLACLPLDFILLLGVLFDSEDRNSTFLGNVHKLLAD